MRFRHIFLKELGAIYLDSSMANLFLLFYLFFVLTKARLILQIGHTDFFIIIL